MRRHRSFHAERDRVLGRQTLMHILPTNSFDLLHRLLEGHTSALPTTHGSSQFERVITDVEHGIVGGQRSLQLPSFKAVKALTGSQTELTRCSHQD